MRKMIKVNERRLAAKYNRRIFLVSLPAVSVLISLLAVVLIFVVFLGSELPAEMYRTVFYAAYAACTYCFVVCFIGSATEEILLRAHREHTYIHISGPTMIVSQHARTVYRDGRWIHYKKMWVVKLAEVKAVECIRNHITITAPARYFNENADWLSYSESENGGVKFDRWWYDQNGGKPVDTIEITDFYTYGERIARHITNCAEKVRLRDEQRESFRRRMLEIAENVKHPRKLPDRYDPKKRKRR